MKRAAAVVVALLAGLLVASATAAQEFLGPSDYLVTGVHTKEDRTAVARTGASIDEVRTGEVVVRATPGERDAIAGLGFGVTPLGRQRDFPAADSAYHNLAETLTDLDSVVQAHPATVRRFTIGKSYEGRDIVGLRISDDAQDNNTEPAVLFVGLHHAREHLTNEVVLSLVHLFAESTDPAVRDLVRTRQLYLIPQLNPDGGEFDIAAGTYQWWRKNRQPTHQPTIGTDLNRNYEYRWGCCGGSSGDPYSETYRGPSPWSAPETDAMRRFVEGRPNLRTAISYHSHGEQILYPYGYTYDDLPLDMVRLDLDMFRTMGAAMAATTGFRSEQLSDLYITDGEWTDWMYGTRRIYAFTFELSGYGYSFYPPDEFIDDEIAKNRDAAVYIASVAGCPKGVVGRPCSLSTDFDGDGDAEAAVFRPSAGTWYVRTAPPSSVAFGVNGDIPVPADYDGDGKAERAVFRPSNGTWYLSGPVPSAVPFGVSGDIPVPGDYDGDGRAEPAVFRPSTGVWYTRGSVPSSVAFGESGDVPVPADYDGDGRLDRAVFRPSTGVWYFGGSSPSAVVFGVAGDVPVPGDYNGDRRAEPAVFRPSNGVWYVVGSSPSAVAFGTTGDVPVPGDYDGDGSVEPGVFRPSNGVWFVGGPAPAAFAFGASGDVPLTLPWAVWDAFF